MKYIVRPVLALALLLGVPAGPANLNVETASAGDNWAYITWCKIYQTMLTRQFLWCYDERCGGCMRREFADPINPFENEDNWNCEGVRVGFPYRPWWVWVRIEDHPECGWVTCGLFTEKSTLERVVNACNQNYPEDVHCTKWVGDSLVIANGAYIVGSEFGLPSLKDLINYDQLGPPPSWDPYGPYPYEYWDHYVDFVLYAVDSYGSYCYTIPWSVANHAAMAWWGDLQMGIITASLEEEEFARKVYVHTLVCSQAWHGWESEWPILTASGIDDWPFTVDDTPTFVYYINNVIDPYLRVPVGTEPVTWGSLRILCR